ncbi:MAG: hypothetical protein KDA54_02650 [Phycisphaerales bacterium]|nr:hypothetical protein [Phycisphaerales bacterium]
MKNILMMALSCALVVLLPSCKKSESEKPAHNENTTAPEKTAESDTHVHADGTTHEADDSTPVGAENDDHAHDEVSLGEAAIGDVTVEFAQGHGKLEAGKEGHLVVKLPYNDKGATIVRAWIGTDDRLKSVVGKGEYAGSHDDYDVHAIAPDPLPENAMWWIEIQMPDGKKSVGWVEPLR